MTRLSVRTDRHLIRTNGRSQRFVLVEVTAPPATRQRRRAPVNLAFVLDRSGSMAGHKLEFAKLAIHDALARLDDRDRFSVVFYDDQIDVIVESTHATDEARRNAIRHLAGGRRPRQHEPGRGLAARLRAGRQAPLRGGRRPRPAAHRRSRQPGHHRPGRAGPPRRRAARPRRVDHHVRRRQRLRRGAAPGDGRCRWRPLLLHRVAAADPRPHRERGGGDARGRRPRRRAGAPRRRGRRGRGHQPAPRRRSRHAVDGRPRRARRRPGGRDRLPPDVPVRRHRPRDRADRRDLPTATACSRRPAIGDARLTWTWADDAANDAQPRDTDVDRAVARQFAARARQEAVRENRAGDYERAQRTLESTARRIRDYAGRDQELRELVHGLEEAATEFSAPVAPAMLKSVHFASANVARSRDASGRASRTPR